MISKKTRLFIPAVVLIIVIAAVAAGCTFTGSGKANGKDDEVQRLQAQLDEALQKQDELEALLENQNNDKDALEALLAKQAQDKSALSAQLEALNKEIAKLKDILTPRQTSAGYVLRFIEDDSFEVNVRLPDGYVLQSADTEADMHTEIVSSNGARSAYDILLDGEKIGRLAYNYYDLYPGTEGLPDTRFAHMVYSEFFNANIADWDSGYTSVKQNGATHTATDRVQWSVPLGGGPRDEYTTANVLAYDDEVFVYVLISFEKSHEISDSQLAFIAENLSVSAQTTMRRDVYDYMAKEYDRVFKQYYDIYKYSMKQYKETASGDAVEATFMFTMNHAALDGSGLQDMNAYYKLVRGGSGAYTLYLDVGGNETTWEELTVDKLVSQ